MLKVYQGDTSDIIELKSHESLILDEHWQAKLVVIESTKSPRPLLSKCFSKDKIRNVFYTALLPHETETLVAGKYIVAFQIENTELHYRREIHEKLKIMPQAVFKNVSASDSIDSECPYTENGTLPEDDIFYIG